MSQGDALDDPRPTARSHKSPQNRLGQPPRAEPWASAPRGPNIP